MNMTQGQAVSQASAAAINEAYMQARKSRALWESIWRDCYQYALPQSDAFQTRMNNAQIFDGTAMDAVDQLASSLLANLTPPWSSWFGLKPGPELSAAEAEALAPVLEGAARVMQAHFDRSNFAVEMHQAFLDLVTAGTGTILFEEAGVGQMSAFKFSALPLSSVTLEEGVTSGRLERVYREAKLTVAQIQARFPRAVLPASMLRERDPNKTWGVIECAQPDAEKPVIRYAVILTEPYETLLSEAQLAASPFIAFRWAKAPADVYGRSPVMKALPDIKTANKVVELILKNASIAVTGIWQADDDGVLNPATVELAPGTIIPKAVGSAGLRPLEMPGRFDVSQLVLDDLRARIRHALLTDRLGQIGDRRMTATEVMERSAETALLLGATYGRLQSELLTPLVQRGWAILRRRGEVPDLTIDGRTVQLDYRSPLARAQGQRGVANTINWITTTLAMGPEAASAIDLVGAARFIGEALGVPSDLIRKDLSNPIQEKKA
ncbi:MAG: phage tail protein [Alphaproteobacteria bacterium]|nr:phage tail protein [Alphaproteobacteria bacterium]